MFCLFSPIQIDRPVEAREGSSVKLECRADGIPVPTIRWRKRVSISLVYNIALKVGHTKK